MQMAKHSMHALTLLSRGTDENSTYIYTKCVLTESLA